MDINEAIWDRALRILVGLPIVILVFVGPKTAWGYLGLIPLVSGVLGHCVLYNVLGISTCKPPAPRDGSHSHLI